MRTEIAKSELHEAARDYASRGLYVFPLRPGDKRPFDTNTLSVTDADGKKRGSFYVATTDPDQIDRWWSKWPNANIAIDCGQSDLVVIDADVKNGVDGTETWRDVVQDTGTTEDTWTVETPSGGLHVYFRANGHHFRNSAGKVGPGLDVRAKGGYIVAPPSRTPVGDYHYALNLGPQDVSTADCTEELARALGERKDSSTSAKKRAEPVEGTIPCGSRHTVLVSLAGTMRARGMNADEIEAALLVTNKTRCEQPCPPEQIQQIALSVAKYAPNDAMAGASASALQDIDRLDGLSAWVRKRLGKKNNRETKLDVAATLSSWLLKHNRLVVDLGQDAPLGGRPYMVADDHALWPLGRHGVSTRKALYKAGLNGTEEVFKFVVEALTMEAYEHGKQVTLHRWQAARDNALYVSCGATHLVRAREGLLETVPNGTDDMWIAGDAAYPEWVPGEPVDPQTLAAFRPCFETPTEVPSYTQSVQSILLVVYLAGLVSAVRPLPALLLIGEKGGGKTTTGKAMSRLLLGPNAAPTVLSKDMRDFWTLTTTSPLVVLDNVDTAPESWFPDALAATITGVSIDTRALYTNFQKLSRSVTAAIALTTRTASFARPDVADRSLPLFTTEFRDSARVADSDLLGEVDAQRDRLLSWCVLTASRLLATAHLAPSALPLRFVDFARLVWAYLHQEGRPETAAQMLVSLRQSQALIIGETDPLVLAILACFPEISADGIWSGTPTDLIKALKGAGARVPDLGGGKRIASQLRETRNILALAGFALDECSYGNGTKFTLKADDMTRAYGSIDAMEEREDIPF